MEHSFKHPQAGFPPGLTGTPATSKLLKIGSVAARTGLPVKTIRYYEEIGLLTPAVERSESGYRLFDGQVLNRLAFIKRAQSLGLSLSEIKEILNVHDRGDLPCGEVKQRLQAKLEAISEQIEALQTLKAELQGVLSGWQEQPPAERIAQTICPNIQFGNDRG
ncbi:heavy metal-responsive transcriptional regulator [Kamptonema formosum]|uniref:heavy metal-responsive transcriptional regulator n=1 Tax=Kamptonema formosum TaxID=331992 RepID=UPI0003459460|nr:heavy metal-responsive transcriptional regulator [Oscillatoria sp. PCC 10802]